jgi:hypothetical protein
MLTRFFSEPYLLYLYDYPSTKTVKAHVIFKPVKRSDNPNPIIILDTIKHDSKILQ